MNNQRVSFSLLPFGRWKFPGRVSLTKGSNDFISVEMQADPDSWGGSVCVCLKYCRTALKADFGLCFRVLGSSWL